MDFADDLCLAAELLELLVPVLEVMATEAVSFGLEVYCQKQWIRLWTYIYHSSWTSQGGRGLYVPCCSYALIISQQPRRSLKWSTYPYRHARPRQAVLEITNFKISLDEIILHVLPIFLYGSECWAIIIKSVCLVILHLWMMLLMQRGFSGGSWLRVALLTPSGASQKSVTVLFNTAFRHFAILCNNASQHSQGM